MGQLMLKLVLVVILSVLSKTVVSSDQKNAGQLRCNGYVELCSRRYTDVTFGATHNSFAVDNEVTPPVISANQQSSMTEQLKYGIRMLSLDIFREDEKNQHSALVMCHGSCMLLNVGPLIDGFNEIHNFLKLKENRNEVLAITIENVALATHEELNQALQESGMSGIIHVQTAPNQQWPTLGEMVTSGKRVIVLSTGLHTLQGNATTPAFSSPVMSHFEYISETPFQIYTEFDWTCSLDRPKGQTRELVLVNHWLYIRMFEYDLPNYNASLRINTQEILGGHVKKCMAIRQQRINFIFLDFYETSDIIQVVAEMNNLPFISKLRPKLPPSDHNSRFKYNDYTPASVNFIDVKTRCNQ